MPAILTYPIAFIGVLGILVVIHEFGHYAVAKLLGVRVEVFSVGFGPRLLGFKKGDTDYRISAIPLGGYVKMSGENPMDERTGDPAEFMSHPRWHRFLIAIAGPVMNIALAIVVLAAVYMLHYEYPVFLYEPATIGWVTADTVAAKAGIQRGDRIVRIDSIQNPTWEQVDPQEKLSPNQPLSIAVQRGPQILELTIVPEAVGPSKYGFAGWVPERPFIVTGVEKDMPAKKAGIRNGDTIVALDGVQLPAMGALYESLQRSKEKPVELTVLRNGQEMKLTLAPVQKEVVGLKEHPYRIGVMSFPMKVIRLPLFEALNRSIDENRKNSSLILSLVKRLLQGRISPRQIEGPIGIGELAGDAAQEEGWTPIMALTAAISLNLGIFNLLPIPILDGGVILLLLIEGLMQRDISLRIKERIYTAAFVFLVIFAVMVIYNDVVKHVPGLAQHLP